MLRSDWLTRCNGSGNSGTVSLTERTDYHHSRARHIVRLARKFVCKKTCHDVSSRNVQVICPFRKSRFMQMRLNEPELHIFERVTMTADSGSVLIVFARVFCVINFIISFNGL